MKNFSTDNVNELNIGDKVTLVISDGSAFEDKFKSGQGTITKITPKTVTIRLYKQQKKVWVVRVGERKQILKGWNLNVSDYTDQLSTIEYHHINGYDFKGNLDTGLIVVTYNGIIVDEYSYGMIKDNKEEFILRCEKSLLVLADNYTATYNKAMGIESNITTETTEEAAVTTHSFNSYNPSQLSESEWTKDISKHTAKYTELKDIEVMDNTTIDSLINNGYNFWIKIVNDNPYFNNDCYLVDLYLSYINKPITVYINKDHYNVITGNIIKINTKIKLNNCIL